MKCKKHSRNLKELKFNSALGLCLHSKARWLVFSKLAGLLRQTSTLPRMRWNSLVLFQMIFFLFNQLINSVNTLLLVCISVKILKNKNWLCAHLLLRESLDLLKRQFHCLWNGENYLKCIRSMLGLYNVHLRTLEKQSQPSPSVKVTYSGLQTRMLIDWLTWKLHADGGGDDMKVSQQFWSCRFLPPSDRSGFTLLSDADLWVTACLVVLPSSQTLCLDFWECSFHFSSAFASQQLCPTNYEAGTPPLCYA